MFEYVRFSNPRHFNYQVEKSFRLPKTVIKAFGIFRAREGAEEFAARFSFLQHASQDQTF